MFFSCFVCLCSIMCILCFCIFVCFFSFCIQLSLSYFRTSLLTTAIGWKPNCSKKNIMYPILWHILDFQVLELQDLRKEVSFLSGWSCRSSHIESQCYFWSLFSRCNIKFAAIGLVFNSSVKMNQYVLYDRTRMLQILLI